MNQHQLTRRLSSVNCSSRRSQLSRRNTSRRQHSMSSRTKLVPSTVVEQPTLITISKYSDRNKTIRVQEKRRPSSLAITFLVYMVRLLILSVGLGAIAGTALTIIDPNTLHSEESKPSESNPASESQTKKQPQTISPPLSLSQELVTLKKKLAALASKYPKLKPGAFFVDLDNGSYINLGGEMIFASASTIKIPILIAFFQDVDAGKIHLDELLTMKKELIAGGSGDMQSQQPGKKFTALETATKMIITSDNTATNMLIARLGGKEALNQRFREWGLTATFISHILPDLEGTNTTTPKDLANLLAMVNQGELVSLKSRDRLLGIMEQTKTRTLLPQGIEKEAIIAHKTGDIGTVLGDAGIVDMPNGKRYIAAVMIKRPHNDYTARTLIQEISRTVYQHFKWYQARPSAKKVEGL